MTINMDCEVPVIVHNSLSVPFWISIEQDSRVKRATYLRLRVCRGRQRICRGRQLTVLACPVYGTRQSYVMGLYGSRDHLGFHHSNSRLVLDSPAPTMGQVTWIFRKTKKVSSYGQFLSFEKRCFLEEFWSQYRRFSSKSMFY